MSGYEVLVLRDIEEVIALGDEWDDLLARLPAPEIFQTHEWVCSWWEVFGEGCTPLVVVVRQERRLVGLAPFVLRGARGRPLGLRRLELMGTGEDERDEVGSEFLDVLAPPELEEAVCRLVWLRLKQERAAWDEALWCNVLGGSALARHLLPLAGSEARAVETRPRGERFFLDLAGGDFAGYVESLSKKRRKRVHYYRRRLEKEGGLVPRRLERKEEIPSFLLELGRLSRLRLAELGKTSAFASPAFRRFHSVLAPRLWDRGWLDLRLWEKQGRPVAAIYGFLYAGTIYYYQSGFDTEAFGNISPGLVTLTEVIEWGFRHGRRRFDFMLGEGGSYKEDYNCQTQPVCDLVVYNDTLGAQALRAARGVERWVRAAHARGLAVVAGFTGGAAPAAPAPEEREPEEALEAAGEASSPGPV
jgi:CelD/BcsL family acetyltransferase involved in cellulose biosynthesis